MASFLLCLMMPLFFSWFFPLMLCYWLWRKGGPAKVSTKFLFGLYPLAFIGLVFGNIVVSVLRPDLFADRGDNPSQVVELMIALTLSRTYTLVVKRLARKKNSGITDKVPWKLEVLKVAEIICWIPTSCILLIVGANTIFVIGYGLASKHTFGFGAVWPLLFWYRCLLDG